MRNLRVFFVALAVFALSAVGFAQTTRGTLAGTVSDKSGAVVGGAAVAIQRTDGGEPRTVTTGSSGEYRMEALNPGSYTVTVSAATFRVAKVEQVVVNSSVITSLNVTLEPGLATESVTVEAALDQIQTETGELSKTIPLEEVKDLPYLSLNAYQLAVTLPGVSTVASRDDFTNGQSFSVNGLRPRANNFLLDGFDNNDNAIAGQAFQPNNTEAVQEVTLLTNAYAPEYGRGGGSVSNLTFRSGTNQLHGSAWDQYTGAGLNALLSEESAAGLTRPAQFVNNIFGFRIGGPVIKNKLFFFGTSQWNRFFGAAPAAQLLLPTAAGVQTLQSIGPNANVDLLLSALGNIRATGDVVATVPIGDRGPSCPAPCNVEIGKFTRSDKGVNLSREWTVRADYAGQSDSIFVRYTGASGSSSPDLFANPFALPSEDTEQGGPSRLLGVMWAHVFSPKILNEFRFSVQQIDFTFGPTAATEANPNAHLPTISMNDSITTFWGGFEQSTFPQGRGHKTFQFQDAVSINKGKHNMKMGSDIAVLLVTDEIPFNADGLINYSAGGDCTAIGIPGANGCTDLANYIDNFVGPTGALSKSFGNPRISVPTNQQAYYFQDSWKVKPNLSLDFGVRYEYQPPDASNVLPFPGVDGSTIGTALFPRRFEVKPDRNNFGPRLGFAYTPKFWQGLFGEDKTVFRGGYGVFYDAFFTNISDNTAGASPNATGSNINGGPGRGPADPLALVAAMTASTNPFTTQVSVNDNLRNPLTHQWNINIQRELPAKIKMEVAYVGTRSERLWVNQQLNPRVLEGPRIVPTRGSIVVRGNKADSIYHGLQTSVTRTVRNFAIRGSYTWSRSLDNGSEVFVTSGTASRWQNVLDPRSDRGPSAFNRTHRAVISYTYEIPFPKGKGFLTAALGGWSTSGIVSFQSGTPETISIGGWDQNGDGEFFNDRPDLGNAAAKINYSQSCLGTFTPCSGVGFDDGSHNLIDWNTGAPGSLSDFRYIVNNFASGHNGNVTRNNFVFPGRQDWNLSVVKRFTMPYGEGHQLEFRGDFFNAFNHPNLGVSGLSGDIDTLNFLDINGTRRGGRSVALWMKYSF